MNIEELLDELNVAYLSTGHKHCRTGWLQLRHCPFCSSSNYHLGFNTTNSYFVCWRCGWHSTWEVLQRLGVGPGRIKELLGQFTSNPISKVQAGPGKLKEPKVKGPLQSAHKRYLQERGFDWKQLVQLWRIEGIGIHQRLGWRIYIPIAYRGATVSWTTRAIGNRVTQRYLSASAAEESVPHKHTCYGIDYCRHSVVICEGPVDAWAVGPGAVGLFGTAFTSAQVRMLVDIPNRFICFDSSTEAQQKAQGLAQQLACFPGSTENLIIDAKDPGEASDKELRLIRKITKVG